MEVVPIKHAASFLITNTPISDRRGQPPSTGTMQVGGGSGQAVNQQRPSNLARWEWTFANQVARSLGCTTEGALVVLRQLNRWVEMFQEFDAKGQIDRPIILTTRLLAKRPIELSLAVIQPTSPRGAEAWKLYRDNRLRYGDKSYQLHVVEGADGARHVLRVAEGA
jgi:hypothetical protein